MSSQYSTEVKADALARLRLGEPVTAIHAQMKATLGSQAPCEKTLYNWSARFRQIAVEQDDRELLDGDYRLALRSEQLVHEAFDYLQEDESGERQAKALIAINAIRGTAIDKIIKRSDGPVSDRGNTFVFINAPTSDIQSIVEVTK